MNEVNISTKVRNICSRDKGDSVSGGIEAVKPHPNPSPSGEGLENQLSPQYLLLI